MQKHSTESAPQSWSAIPNLQNYTALYYGYVHFLTCYKINKLK